MKNNSEGLSCIGIESRVSPTFMATVIVRRLQYVRLHLKAAQVTA